ncbi:MULTISPECIES: helix-turn-helix domain-containing protein [unclassified Methylophilus]|uniref:helix-turn-helix domain-containing protein n=1 Tax=unclassified Methylophilus TaxID=2630143 RepID=UPI001E5569D9|nr:MULTISPECIES: helix-turn-helix transcriptional regulator [unclassified Methylophilus]
MNSNLANKIGRLIAERRSKAGLTQEEVAEKLGIGFEAVSRIERAKSIPTVLRLFELADIFSCGVDELLIEASNRPIDQASEIAKMLSELTIDDRQMILETVKSLHGRLKQ